MAGLGSFGVIDVLQERPSNPSPSHVTLSSRSDSSLTTSSSSKSLAFSTTTTSPPSTPSPPYPSFG
eukprot:CAMPEP_0175975082 /NCGR_PEP_ID=MMETSP0108-20121206/43743_1 /TAXON_ID=195067 ORGANISM="Goniomonas pacifica, Strain CCMP1869" /NCGR_SAMPLE_ID=MMETSP0108 /ASSEMBLY_ACC=CAM_ASM_000204 /LENGTH=65 /DNA_ID=CAMNT_0017304783 /DNA_START=38 /DNA_END=232 /DNA_ORIENTATION=-